VRRILAALVLLSLSSLASAHVATTRFLSLYVEGQALTGSMEIALRDVELAVGVDADHDGHITWGELRAAQPRLNESITAHLQLSASGKACPVQLDTLKVNNRVDGPYAWLALTAHCFGSFGALNKAPAARGACMCWSVSGATIRPKMHAIRPCGNDGLDL
jgi:hypothetical protein